MTRKLGFRAALAIAASAMLGGISVISARQPWTPTPATSQTQDADLGPRILSCALHETAGPWVHAVRYGGSPIQFNYLHEGPNPRPGPYDYRDGNDYLYAAFWNRERTAGEFLQFIWFRGASKPHLRIVNNASIVSSRGRLDLEDALWGVWTYEHLKRRLLRLKSEPTEIVSLGKSGDGTVMCDSYVHPIDGPDTGKTIKKNLVNR